VSPRTWFYNNKVDPDRGCEKSGDIHRDGVRHRRQPHTSTHAHTHPYRMGSKKNKIKKVLAPTSPPTNDANADANTTSTSNDNADDDQHLMDELFSQLDSRGQSVRSEPATVLEEVRTRQAAQAAPPDKAGGNSKARFKARQVRPRFATPAPPTVTSLSLRQGKPQRLLNTSHPSIPTPMRSSSGRPRRRNVLSTGYATS
jgi:hypothetical protein